MYASAVQLLDRYNAEEIAQRADHSVPPLVDGELLQKAAAGDDLSDYTPEQQQAAAKALANVERALQDAGHTINSYISGRYQLPLSQAPAVLELHCCQIARFVLFDDAAPEQIKSLFQASLKYLRDVSSGAADLGLTATGTTAAPSSGAEMVSSPLVFSRDNGRGFI